MLRGSKIRIGDLLVASGDITTEELDAALLEQRRSGEKLGKILVQNGRIEEERLLSFLAEQLGVPFIDLKTQALDETIVNRLPETYARRYRAIVIEEQADGVLVGMADPIDIFAYDEIARQLDAPMNVAVVRESDLLAVFDRAYRRTEEIESFASELDDELTVDEFSLGGFKRDEDSTPVAKLLQSILEDAVQIRASDVHIEPDDEVLRLRQRVDGVLQEQLLPEVRIAPALVSRLKLMAGLDISERRLPQDGRFEHKLSNTSVDVRLSTLPTSHGESVVMRLVDHSSARTSLDDIGMASEMLSRFRRLVKMPHGLILVTGPTGSGKTTTLYGALNELNQAEKKIITVEDPVEVQLARVNQVQVNPKIGLEFAGVLRAALRQDPDVLLVGEIRDEATAEIAMRAAMTGHMVLSTLHTNDAVTSVTRLMDIGIAPYLAASTVRAIVAQRLVRKLCDKCSEMAPPEQHVVVYLESIGIDPHQSEFGQGKGCGHCNHTGYKGRVGVFELLEMTHLLADALRREDEAAFVNLAAEQEGYVPLARNALTLAQQGITSLDEVMALVGQEVEVELQTPQVVPPTLDDAQTGIRPLDS